MTSTVDLAGAAMTDAYSSTISGERPEEVQRAREKADQYVPEDMWEPGSLGRSVWNTERNAYETWLADPDTGELELDVNGQPERAYWEAPTPLPPVTDDGDPGPANPEASTGNQGIAHLSRQSLAAVHFVRAVGHRVRFDHGRRVWYLWREHRWETDRTSEIRRLWLDVIADRYRTALGITDGARRTRVLEAIQTAGATDAAIEAGIRIAASSEPVALAGDEWDRDPWVIGCENGIVDLRTGYLRPGRPEDLITRSTGLEYDPAADCARWDLFLAEVFAGDAALVEWFRRLVGASLVGTSKEVLALHHGGGNNGKSVMARTIRQMAGDYAVEIAIETLMNAKRDAGAPTSDLMRLRGARLAFTSEPDQGSRLKGGTLKRLATIDQMSGRELHGTQQSWDPTHTLHLASNHLPEVDDASDGFWRRIALIPWTVRFAKPGEPGPAEDPNLTERLAREAPGILAWAVRGAVAYAVAGTLHPFPPAVARETAAYRSDEDPLGGFIAAWLSPADDDLIVTSGALFLAYAGWADDAGVARVERLTSRSFGRMFAERHLTLGWPVRRVVIHGRTGYRGLCIAAPDPETERESTAAGGVGALSDPFPGSSSMPTREERLGNPRNDQPTPPRSSGATNAPGHPRKVRTCPVCHLEHPAGTTCADGWAAA